MITIFIYGLDQFVIGKLSKEMTPSLAKLYECDADDINFVACDNMVFHNGVEQTSWNILIHVNAPMKVRVLQDMVAKYIIESIGDLAIHKALEFYYFSEDNRYEKVNPDYPKFIANDNLVSIDEEENTENLEEGEGDDQIYTGDIFSCLEDDDCGHHHDN